MLFLMMMPKCSGLGPSPQASLLAVRAAETLLPDPAARGGPPPDPPSSTPRIRPAGGA